MLKLGASTITANVYVPTAGNKAPDAGSRKLDPAAKEAGVPDDELLVNVIWQLEKSALAPAPPERGLLVQKPIL